MPTTKTKNLPAWTPEGQTWSSTPIWDEEFAERWQALQRQGEEPKPPVVKRPGTGRKPRSPRTTR